MVSLHMHVFYLDRKTPLIYTFTGYNLALAEITTSEMSPLHISCKFNLKTLIQVPEAIFIERNLQK